MYNIVNQNWLVVLFESYVHNTETTLYYINSRYYDPSVGRFISADALISTGQGLLGNNMFTYCLNNPVNYIDRKGTNAEVLQWWTIGMGWLPFSDATLPIGDIIYYGGILLFGTFSREQDCIPKIFYDKADVGNSSSSSNNDDDDDDDGYYNDESNFGGRQKIGKKRGSTPGNNQAQNKQFSDATKGLSPEQQRIVHDIITGKGLGYHGIQEIVKDLFFIFIGIVIFEE